MTLTEEVKLQATDALALVNDHPMYAIVLQRVLDDYAEVCRGTVEACQGQLRVMADLAPTEHKSIYQLAIKQLRSLLPQPTAQEDKNG